MNLNNLDKLNDYTLISIFKKTDSQDLKNNILTELVTKYNKEIWRNVHKFYPFFSNDNSVDKEDIYNELFIFIYKALKWIKPDKIKNKNTYSFWITLNKFISSYGKRYTETASNAIMIDYSQLNVSERIKCCKFDYPDIGTLDKAYKKFYKTLTLFEKKVLECRISNPDLSLRKLAEKIEIKKSRNIYFHNIEMKKKFISAFQHEGYFEEKSKVNML